MVFVLEDIAKIESDRLVKELGIVENFSYTQRSDDILRDPRTAQNINEIMEQYVMASQFYVWGPGTAGVLGVFTDAFLNAGMWGNKNIPGKRIQVCIKYGLYGSVIYVEDEGLGFDYRTQIEKLRRGEAHDFFHNGGGLRKFHASTLNVAYHDCGNIVSIATRVFSQDELQSFMKTKRLE